MSSLLAELRAEADSWPNVHDSDRRVIALLHRAADALEECEKAERVAKSIHRKKGLRIDICD